MSLEELESLFEDAKLKPKTQEQPTVQTAATLFGKVPIWPWPTLIKPRLLYNNSLEGKLN